MTRDNIYGQYGANIFAGLMTRTDYDSMVKDGGYTMFVPSDDSLRNMSSEDYSRWTAQNGDFSRVLGSHIVRERINSNQFSRTVISINGTTITLTVVNGQLFVNGHRVIRVERNNGNFIYIVSGDITTPVVY